LPRESHLWSRSGRIRSSGTGASTRGIADRDFPRLTAGKGHFAGGYRRLVLQPEFVIDGWSTGYDQAVEYQMWLRGNHRAVAADPTVPPDPDNPYSNLTFVMDGPVIAHAVAAGTSQPECGVEEKVLIPGLTRFPRTGFLGPTRFPRTRTGCAARPASACIRSRKLAELCDRCDCSTAEPQVFTQVLR
jgi:hypothetical protein